MEDYNLLVVFRSERADLAEEEIRRLISENGLAVEHMARYNSSDMFCVKLAGDPWDLVLSLMESPDKLVHTSAWIPADRLAPNDEGQIEVVLEEPSDWVKGESGMMRLRKKKRL